MKHLFSLIALFIFGTALQAQDFSDAWRYAQSNVNGSARFVGMSGAFSSLGGDMSAIGLNPAGGTTFTTNRFSGTLSFFNTNNTANYFNNNHTTDYTSFDDQFLSMDQLGGVFVFKSDESDWNKMAIAVNYNKEANYYNDVRIQGVNTTGNSVAQYFLNNTNGFKLKDLELLSGETIDDAYADIGEVMGFDAQQGFLAYQSYLVNPVDPNNDDNTDYTSAASYTTVAHQNNILTSGNKSRMDFGISGTYKKNLQLGFAFTSYNIEYTENNTIIENGYDSTSDLQSLKLRNTLRVEGSGLGLKLGAIYKINDLRLSIAYHSPQWLEIEEFMKQAIDTDFSNGDHVSVAPQTENAFAPYKIVVPSKVILGGSAVLAKKALISVDYTYQNMANLHFKEKDADADTSYFDAINNGIADNMQAVHKLNVGGEVRLDKIYLRAGGFMATSPVKENADVYTKKGFSLGAGFSFNNNMTLDLGYLNSSNQSTGNVLNVPDNATIDSKKNKFVLGLRYNF